MHKIAKGVALAVSLTSVSASGQVMVGAYLPGEGYNPVEIGDYNAVMPKSLAFVNVFSSFSHDWDHLYWQTTNIVNEGAMPLISWMPVDLNRPDINILSEIALGLHDPYIDQWAGKLAAWVAQYPVGEQPKILLRFGHEFNGNWYSYGNSPFLFQSAWQYIHDRFEVAGVNKHIEWVWSANNVNVDDYNDITAYYPGSAYVDWTSIDGYNFGSNYAWTDWESFSSLYADIYLTLVNQFPEKPILIAEVGSAEEHDIPNPDWGQYGDDSDAYESKEEWIADFMQQLETNFPAVRAISWFNTNKELGWALTEQGNSGYNAYTNAIYSNHFTSDFLSAPSYEENTTAPTEVELALVDATATYESVQIQFTNAELILSDAQTKLVAAQSALNYRRNERADAYSLMKSHQQEFYDLRSTYQNAANFASGAASQFIARRDEVTSVRGEKDLGSEELLTAMSVRTERWDEYLIAWQYHIVARDAYLAAHEAYLSAVETRDSSTGAERESAQKSLLEASKARAAAVDAFRTARAEMTAANNRYLDSVTTVTDLRQKLDEILVRYNLAIGNMNLARNQHNEALENKDRLHAELMSKREIYLGHHEVYLAVNQSYQLQLESVAVAQNLVDQSEALVQQLEQERSLAFSEMTSASQLVALQNQSQGLILSDSSNSTNVGNKGKNSLPDTVNNGRNLTVEKGKSLAKMVKIDKTAQSALAQSRRPDPVDPAEIVERAQKYKNISAEEKEALKRQKLSVLQY